MMTVREYAEHRRVSRQAIEKAIKKGRLGSAVQLAPDGSWTIPDPLAADAAMARNSDYTKCPQRLFTLPKQRSVLSERDLQVIDDDLAEGYQELLDKVLAAAPWGEAERLEITSVFTGAVEAYTPRALGTWLDNHPEVDA